MSVTYTGLSVYALKQPITMGEMAAWVKRFKNAKAVPNKSVRNFRLSNLMSDLERSYNIPMLKNENYEKANPHIMKIYRAVEEERSFK